MWAIASVILVVGLYQAKCLGVKASTDPQIPSTVDKDFIKFQEYVANQQSKSSVDVLYRNLDDFKSGFEQFKTTGAVNSETITSDLDPDFEQFQKFVTKFFREYNSMDEFITRYNLFLTVLNKFKGYNIGGDLIGINRLSDRTDSEKLAQYGRPLVKR